MLNKIKLPPPLPPWGRKYMIPFDPIFLKKNKDQWLINSLANLIQFFIIIISTLRISENNREYPIRKYDFSSKLLNVPYTYREFLFALGNFPYIRMFAYAGMGKIIHNYGKYHTQVWKIFHYMCGLMTSNKVWKISEDFFLDVFDPLNVVSSDFMSSCTHFLVQYVLNKHFFKWNKFVCRADFSKIKEG